LAAATCGDDGSTKKKEPGHATQPVQPYSATTFLQILTGFRVRFRPLNNGICAAETRWRLTTDTKETWDFFICHILPDREIARSLTDALNAKGLRVWYADYSLKVGDPLTALLDFGLSRSRMGIVIVSPQFLQQCWPAQELNALASREVNGKKVILPVWHKVSFRDVFDYSPVLADTVAISTSKGLDYAVQRIMDSAR
jgi:TIR domain